MVGKFDYKIIPHVLDKSTECVQRHQWNVDKQNFDKMELVWGDGN